MQDLQKLDTASLEAMKDEDALKLWQKTNTPEYPKSNRIVLDNGKYGKDDKLNPNFGKILAYSYDDGQETVRQISTGEEFYPIMSRVQIMSQFVENKPQYLIKEVDQGLPIEVLNPETKEVLFSGSYQDAKEEFNLKYKQVVYAYYEGKTYRWLLGGGDTRNTYFEVSNAIRQLKQPRYIKIDEIVPMKNATTFWNEIKFSVGGAFDVKTALTLQMQLARHLGTANEPTEAANSEDAVDAEDLLPF